MKKPMLILCAGLALLLNACSGSKEEKVSGEEEKINAAEHGVDTSNENYDIDTIHNKHAKYDNP